MACLFYSFYDNLDTCSSYKCKIIMRASQLSYKFQNQLYVRESLKSVEKFRIDMGIWYNNMQSHSQ